MRFLSAGDLGRAVFLLLAVVLIARDRKRGLVAVLGAALTITLSDQLSSHVIKPWIGRARPCHALPLDEVVLLVDQTGSFSFPSSHATNGFAGALYFSYWLRRLTWPLFVLAALIGFSRIAVGVHYPLDVAAGTVLGLACAASVLAVMRRLGWGRDPARTGPGPPRPRSSGHIRRGQPPWPGGARGPKGPSAAGSAPGRRGPQAGRRHTTGGLRER